MIWDIYIITSSGICLFHKSYHKQYVDESIISGFLTAFASFIKSFDSEEEIESVVMRNIKFVYSTYNDLLFVICADKSEKDDVLKKKLKALRDTFLDLFSKELKEWSGDVSVFRKFETFADEIMKSHIKIALVGKENVGKTSLISLITGENIGKDHPPTMLINIKEFDLPSLNIRLILWDLGGQERFRPFWERLTRDADIILFVCESTPRGVYEAKELFNQISDFLKPAKVILIANKQDLPNALPPEKISEILGLKAHGMVAIDPNYRGRILKILENAIIDLTSKQTFQAQILQGRESILNG